jgi:hypothetical protein
MDSMSAPDVLRRITTALDRAGIAYMLTGSFASAHHGAPRSTLDIDIIIAANSEQLRIFVKSLPSGEYYSDLGAALEAHGRQSLFNVIDLATGWSRWMAFLFLWRPLRTWSSRSWNGPS